MRERSRVEEGCREGRDGRGRVHAVCEGDQGVRLLEPGLVSQTRLHRIQPDQLRRERETEQGES
jgi:hypothetical protein